MVREVIPWERFQVPTSRGLGSRWHVSRVSHPGLPHRCCWPGPSQAHLVPLRLSSLPSLCLAAKCSAWTWRPIHWAGLTFVLGGLTSPVFLGWITSASHSASLNCSPIVDSRNTSYPLPFCNWNRFQWSQIFFFLIFCHYFHCPASEHNLHGRIK